MYTEHEKDGGGGGSPEHMKVKFGIAMIPTLAFEGGCEGCKQATRGALNKMLMLLMIDVAQAFVELLQKGRGNCEVSVMSTEEVKSYMRQQFGDEATDKLLEALVNG